MIPYLEGFTKRMELIACIASIIKRKNTNRLIESRFNEYELDNIIISVLVYIMECTLTEESDCTLNDIQSFLAETLPIYGKEFSQSEVVELSRYIIKDILQNKGESFNYHVMDYSENTMKSQNVRLITDHKNVHDKEVYVLTTQGYNMLLRTKEVDDLLGFQVEEMRLQLLINKKNYSEAFEQTLHLILMLNEKQTQLRLFERKLLNDLDTISSEEYYEIIQGINSTLNDEYQAMENIDKTVRLAQLHLSEEENLMHNDQDSLLSAKEYIFKIYNNVRSILNKQRVLLTDSQKLGDLYYETLKANFAIHKVHRFNFEDTILKGLESYDQTNLYSINEIFAKLLAPLMLPKLPTTLNLGLFYEPQLNQEESNESVELSDDEPTLDSAITRRIVERNEAHTTVIRLLLEFAQQSVSTFQLCEFWEYCKSQTDVKTLTKEKLIFMVLLQLYEYQTIDIDLWKTSENGYTECQGEFDLSYALEKVYEIQPDMYGVKSIHIEKGTSKVRLEWLDDTDEITCYQAVEMDDLTFITEVTVNA